MDPTGPPVHLVAYADRLGGDLARLRGLLDGPLAAFGGVHLLPFFTPHDGRDAGFDPVDHGAVDPRLGSWDDVAALARRRHVWADLVVNHVSASSEAFVDWLATGAGSGHDGMFLTFDRVFPKGATEADLAAIVRPRPGLPLTPYAGADGARRLVWTTFDPTQVDLDVDHPAARRYLDGLLDRLAAAGVGTVRLDAVAYAVKSPGTPMFLTEECLAFVDDLAGRARRRGMRVLAELHGHHADQRRLAGHVDLIYDFALPPLVLHAFHAADVVPLDRWLGGRPSNAVTVLDTHDGIGLVDVDAGDAGPGLLAEQDLDRLVATVDAATGGVCARATRPVPWRRVPYALNTTFLDALGGDRDRLLAARLLQLFVPGEPQVYYVGLLGGRNDVARAERSGEGRELNRHRYDGAEVAAALADDHVRAVLAAVRLRGGHPAFAGTSRRSTSPTTLELVWERGPHTAALAVDVAAGTFGVTWTDGRARRCAAASARELAGALVP